MAPAPTDWIVRLAALPDNLVVACTLIAEAESGGTKAMTEVACVIQNRLKFDPRLWGNTLRAVCLHPYAFSCWNAGPNHNRDRVLYIAAHEPSYPAYVQAQAIVADMIRLGLKDVTGGACGYYNATQLQAPKWAIGKVPCYVSDPNLFYDRRAMLT